VDYSVFFFSFRKELRSGLIIEAADKQASADHVVFPQGAKRILCSHFLSFTIQLYSVTTGFQPQNSKGAAWIEKESIRALVALGASCKMNIPRGATVKAGSYVMSFIIY
jgi:hypothetical protein